MRQSPQNAKPTRESANALSPNVIAKIRPRNANVNARDAQFETPLKRRQNCRKRRFVNAISSTRTPCAYAQWRLNSAEQR
jgi:hypothetical protein